ncbi:heme A synthase [Natronosporangium hydrolyticum]|uniref:Heme A synthase n=1 Tax=Natronosporangium hydrolyticum TaxID=2811111 RepID=A0A895YGR8_9ACTN|nr:COX15/CtaA family protein [Natronosporangium hydrolyticum]QSB12888.1 heme A synthase [Natronosporangium hydrolyticum]
MTVSLALVRRLAFGSLLANIGIVITGGAVRLTGSGLGCPTWPRCTDDSWTSTAEMGIHGAVEFGNRLLTFVLSALAIGGLIAAWRLRPRQPRLLWPAAAVLLGVAIQGVIGGITVLTDLNPWIVGTHFMVSIVIIAIAYTFWRRAREHRPAAPVTSAPLRTLASVIIVATLVLLTVGTVVTGSGPHAGDANVDRNGLDPETLSHLHANLSYLLLGLAGAAWLAVRAVDVGQHARRAAGLLVAVIVAQGTVGLVQYYTGLPEVLVGLHLLGSCLTWVAALDLRYALGGRAGPTPAPEPSTGERAAAPEAPVAAGLR